MDQDKINSHLKNVADLNTKLAALQEKKNNFPVQRLSVLIAGILLCILFWQYNIWLVVSAVNLVIIAFVWLSFKETKLNNKATFIEKNKQVFELEIQLHKRNFEGLDKGESFFTPNHDFAFDLDVFGEKSLFQLLNRTSTFTGRNYLGSWLNNPPINPNEIKERQSATKELAAKEDWCYAFETMAKSSNNKADTHETIVSWLGDEPLFKSGLMKLGMIALPIVTIICGTAYLFDILPGKIFLTLFFMQLGISARYASRITKVQAKLGSRLAIIENYINMVSAIENQKFSSKYLNDLQRIFVNPKEQFSVLSSLTKLKKGLDKLDARLNIYLAIVLNGLFLWDINNCAQIEKWKEEHKANLPQWMNAIGEFDAMISIALFAANQNTYNYPVVSEKNNHLNYSKVGHPMITPDKLVTNNYTISGDSKIDILTGANMAGKSTFLRTIGVNLILARIGAPVCAAHFEFTPLKLFSSLRTADSLKDNESFFYAELKRLKQMIGLYEANEPVFFLLDEILKGTNSLDQHKGAVGLIEKLLHLKAMGIIATHDIELAELEKEHPNNVRNICFEIEINNDELKFDYTVKPGFCKTMNASFLMKKMSIIN